jgi:hypothetical protein
MTKGRPIEDARQELNDAASEQGADRGKAETFREAVRDVAARIKTAKRLIASKRNRRPWPR